MNESSENDISLDLQFLPEWAQEDSGSNKYSSHSGNDRGGEARRGRGRKGQYQRSRSGNKARGDASMGKGRSDNRRGGGDRKDRPLARESRGGRKKYYEKGDRFQRPKVPKLNLKVDFVPDEKGVESIAKEIKLTGRAYPLFQIALLILNRSSRYSIKLSRQNNSGDKEAAQRLFRCKLDETIWLTKEQCVRHALSGYFENFYETQKTETERPKGNFTFVAKCGVTGKYLGAPNHHNYQNGLVVFHAEHLPRMPFEKFKSRIQIVKDEEAVNEWLEECKWKTEFVSIKTDNKDVFGRRDEVQTHFESNHLEEVFDEMQTCFISGDKAQSLQEPRQLAEFLKDQWHRQKHFPMQLSTHLSRIFSNLGLQFFKKDKKVTHVSVARPSFLDIESEPVSESVRLIMQFIDATNNCTRRQILEYLADTGGDEVDKVEDKTELGKASGGKNQVISDLHWLIHQGHVLEFSDGIIETSKRPKKKLEAIIVGSEEEVKKKIKAEAQLLDESLHGREKADLGASSEGSVSE